MTTADTHYTVAGLKQGQTYTFKVEAVGRGIKYSKRERLSDVYPNELVPVKDTAGADLVQGKPFTSFLGKPLVRKLNRSDS